MLKSKIIQKLKIAAATLCMFSIIGIAGCSDDNGYNGHWVTDVWGKKTCFSGGDECKATETTQCSPGNVVSRFFSFK